MASTVIPVNLLHCRYDIVIAADLLSCIDQFVQEQKVMIITDENVNRLYGHQLEKALHKSGRVVGRLQVPAGETSKSVQQAQRLWDQMLNWGADRWTSVVALGGGVVGDLAGFVAATYARGLALVHVPTTLLAQVDSSIGGKVGVNLPQAKNMVGCFWHPKAVVVDPAALQTLDDCDYRQGLAEVVKYAMIMDGEFFDFLESSVDLILRRDLPTLQHLIGVCCRCKAGVVQQDERETTGIRVLLNYGHTFAHAIESVFQYKRFSHGQAVSIGMSCAANLAQQRGMLDSGSAQRQDSLLTALGLPTECPPNERKQIVQAMRHDKKSRDGRFHLVLPSRIGQAELVFPIAEAELLAAMR